MKKALLLAFTITSLSAFAQDKIEAERPNESITPKTLNKNAFQAEFGFHKTREEEADKIWRTPNVLLRYGLLEKVELRAETTVENQRLVSEGVERSGLRPVELGLKINVFETKNEAFSTAIVGQVGIPAFAASSHRPEKAYHRIRVLFENKISDKLSLNYNAGTDYDSEDQKQNWVYTFAPELEIGEKWEAFVEAFGFVKKGKTPENVFDAGLAYFIGKNEKLDLSAGRGLNPESPKYFVAAGLSFSLGGR